MSSGLCHLCLGGPGERRVAGYRIHVCLRCWENASEGWPRAHEPALLDALGRAGLLIPDRTDAGLLPRAYAPPQDFAL